MLTPRFMPLGPSALTRSSADIPRLAVAASSCKKANCFLRNIVLLSANPALAFGTLQDERIDTAGGGLRCIVRGKGVANNKIATRRLQCNLVDRVWWKNDKRSVLRFARRKHHNQCFLNITYLCLPPRGNQYPCIAHVSAL